MEIAHGGECVFVLGFGGLEAIGALFVEGIGFGLVHGLDVLPGFGGEEGGGGFGFERFFAGKGGGGFNGVPLGAGGSRRIFPGGG